MCAPREGVSDSARGTATDGVVVLDFADSEDAAGPRTGVNALLGNTGKTGGAVWVLETLSSATLSRHRVTLVASPAAADHLASSVLVTLSVGSTW